MTTGKLSRLSYWERGEQATAKNGCILIPPGHTRQLAHDLGGSIRVLVLAELVVHEK
jgi:hypothetical protein